jgi:hypothetical protein
MNSLIKLVLFITLPLPLIYPILSSASVDTNIVANPSFENGDTTPLNWTFVTNNGNNPLWDTVAHSGERSIRVQVE